LPSYRRPVVAAADAGCRESHLDPTGSDISAAVAGSAAVNDRCGVGAGLLDDGQPAEIDRNKVSHMQGLTELLPYDEKDFSLH